MKHTKLTVTQSATTLNSIQPASRYRSYQGLLIFSSLSFITDAVSISRAWKFSNIQLLFIPISMKFTSIWVKCIWGLEINNRRS